MAVVYMSAEPSSVFFRDSIFTNWHVCLLLSKPFTPRKYSGRRVSAVLFHIPCTSLDLRLLGDGESFLFVLFWRSESHVIIQASSM